MNYIKILISILFFIIYFSSCTPKNNNKADACVFDTDCEANAFCLNSKCQNYKTCKNTSECINKENCINNQCKKRHCMNDDECGTDEYCLEDFNCIHIPKKKVGELCLNYGNLECVSNQCIADEYRFFCTQNCNYDTDCPDFMFCDFFFDDKKSCIYKDTNEGDHQGGYGSDCSINGDSDCIDAYKCVKNINNKQENKCLNSCSIDSDCYLGYKCSFNNENNNYFCIPPANKLEGQLCNKFNGLECKNTNDQCLKITKNNDKYCTKSCKTNSDCINNSICKKFENGNYCIIPGTANLGESCKNGGNQECIDELICDKSYPRGPLCTKECLKDEECPSYNSCTFTYGTQKLCRPAINGLGNRNGELGSTCYSHGDSDCKTNLLCLTAALDDKDAYCTYHCNTDSDCGNNFHCSDTVKTSNKLCVKGKQGELGSNCYNERCNEGLFCNIKRQNDYTATCTKTCETIGQPCEKEGFYCNNIYQGLNLCLNKIPDLIGKLGDKCPNGKCEDGLSCIYDSDGNFCSKSCNTIENICPNNFVCNHYDETHSFCYKK